MRIIVDDCLHLQRRAIIVPLYKLDSLLESILSGEYAIGEVKMARVAWLYLCDTVVSPVPKLLK